MSCSNLRYTDCCLPCASILELGLWLYKRQPRFKISIKKPPSPSLIWSTYYKMSINFHWSFTQFSLRECCEATHWDIKFLNVCLIFIEWMLWSNSLRHQILERLNEVLAMPTQFSLSECCEETQLRIYSISLWVY